MAINQYVIGLLNLKTILDSTINGEIEEVMRGRGDSNKLKESLWYILDDNASLNGRYKEYETRI